MKFSAQKLISGGYGVFLYWPKGIAAFMFGPFYLVKWHHWYSAGMSRHEVHFGPFALEWAYQPRWVSDEQAKRETYDCLRNIIKKNV